MVNEMRALLHEAAATPPADDIDLAAVLAGGRQRVRRRRARLAGGLAVAVVGVVAAGTLVSQGADGRDTPAASVVPRPDGPVIGLSDAAQAKEGVDYDVLASYTNEDLDAANGQYYDGVTDDGLILFRDGPHGPENKIRYALLDPATGEKDWLPPVEPSDQVWAVELGAERLVLAGVRPKDGMDLTGALVAHVYDRGTRTWSTTTWAGLPAVTGIRSPVLGPDGRLYVRVPATQGSPPPGGWPTGPDGEADDAGAEGETYDLWSVSLSDPADVRDERLRVGSVAFTDDAMIWSAASNGINLRIHVRDLATGAEHDFDPKSGKRCNLLGFGAVADRVVLSQYCGTYDNGRDDRIQVLTTDGDLVTTIQGDGIDGWVTGGVVKVSSHDRNRAGLFVYEPDSGRFTRISDANSSYGLGGPTPEGYLLWDTPVGKASSPQEPIPGATQWLARWR
ncbi:hypothetical protein KVF89_13790 [Nocardioides carbamazepini]|uniref:hypothetical protein n=1 Tax=Nocardioides carbamazepini TaxID=2854259 RepID=UPI00214A31D9|nr:hypothetical protein [Nocardioides carbamazepini]MCR1783608.1 hypothetical protein [Nocardioides carbamazepini]